MALRWRHFFKIFHIERGTDGVFGGTATVPSDDLITGLDAAAAGVRGPEDVEVDVVTGHLWVVSGPNKAIAEYRRKTGALI